MLIFDNVQVAFWMCKMWCLVC